MRRQARAIRFTILAALVAAFFLVPVAQAAASTIKVNIAGTGTGKVREIKLYSKATPPIDCSYAAPGPATGDCEGTLETPTASLAAFAGEGSEFGGWTVTKAKGTLYCDESEEEKEFVLAFNDNKEPFSQPYHGMDGACFIEPDEAGEAELTAFFDKEGPEPPTNKSTLTLTKSPDPSTGAGAGTVSSKPKGLKCATACTEAVGSFYKESSVVLTATPAGETSTFKEWVGCDTPSGTTCTMSMSADKEVKAVFAGTSKAILSPTALTLSKGESESNRGYGTVKATGLTCESECQETTVLYQGTITEPKPVAAKTVELKAAPAFGSKFTGWSGGGCSGTEAVCKVTMNEATTVTAEFADLPDKALTVEKAYEGGLGAVLSKPKGIKCGTTCTTTSANMPEGAAILLTAKPASTEPATTFVKWEGGDCAGLVTTTCTVTMDKAETVKAVFSGPVKAITNPQKLTLTKEGTGYGTVKAAGLTCEVLCTAAATLYAGPPKAAKVTLKATSAPGSKAVEWTGCESNPTPSECVVTMSEAKAVVATFDELE